MFTSPSIHLINFVTDPSISVKSLGNKYSIYVGSTTRLKGAFTGIGAFAFYLTPKPVAAKSAAAPVWNNRLVMTVETRAEFLRQISPNEPVQLELPDPSPCDGLMTADMEGFIVAPTIRLEMDDGRDVAIMLLSSTRSPPKLNVGKTTLSISSDKYDATVLITVDEGLSCTGTVSGQGFRTAKILLTRSPNCPTLHRGFVQQIGEIKGPGQINATWRPVSRIYRDTLVVFRPDNVKDYDLEQIANQIGAADDAFMGEDKPQFIIGDGCGTSYKLTLVLDRFLRRELSDETSITLGSEKLQ